MITTKLLAGITSLALTGAAAYYSLSPLNQAFAVQNDAQEENNDTGLVRPDWIPYNTESMLEFINNYGKTYTGDGLACVVVLGGEEPETSEAAVVYHQEYSHPSYSKNIRIYVYQFSSELTVKADSHTYTFVNDNGTVRENDIFSWLPDCITEYNAFLKEYGRISVFDDYIVFCDASSPGTGYGWINTEGKESVEKVLESDCSRTWDARPTGAGSNSIVLYSPADEGEFNFSWVYAQPWAIDRTASGSVSKTFIVSEGRITEKNEDAENSGTEDSKLFEGMTAAEFIEKAAESGETIKQETYKKFEEIYGELSVHGKYVVFCSYHSCMNSNSFDYTGAGTLREIQKCMTDAPAATGGSTWSMYILQADTPGEIKFNVYTENHAYSAPKELRYTADLAADENLNITIEGKDESGITGDINSDGKADITDLSELALALVGDQTFTETQKKAADVDGDGEVKLSDLAKFRQFLSKVIESLE